MTLQELCPEDLRMKEVGELSFIPISYTSFKPKELKEAW